MLYFVSPFAQFKSYSALCDGQGQNPITELNKFNIETIIYGWQYLSKERNSFYNIELNSHLQLTVRKSADYLYRSVDELV